MSAMILCRGKVADNPLYIMQSGIRLYTEEELCYYIYNNIYIYLLMILSMMIL